MRPVAVLLCAVLPTLVGCSLKQDQPTEIPPPETPTDVREAHRIERAVGVYLEDQRLIRETRQSCARGLPPGLFERVCGPELRPLVAQRRTHLHEGLDDLESRVGPVCAASLAAAGSVPIGSAGGRLRRASRACLREYRRAVSAAAP